LLPVGLAKLIKPASKPIPIPKRKKGKKHMQHSLIDKCSNKLICLDQIIFPEIPLNDYQH
jgi:hypothetical protein